jgi:hypothetical protein
MISDTSRREFIKLSGMLVVGIAAPIRILISGSSIRGS